MFECTLQFKWEPRSMAGKEQPKCPTKQRETDQTNQYLQDDVADLQRHEKYQTTCDDDSHPG